LTLRKRFFLHLLALHLAVGLVCGIFLWEFYRPWIFVVEALLLCSLLLYQRLVKANTQSLELISDGSRFIRDSDFSHTFVPSPSTEVNRLVQLYNDLIRRLRKERQHQEEQHFFLEKVLQVSPAGVMTFDPDHNIRFANPAAKSLLQTQEGKTPTLPDVLVNCWPDLAEGDTQIISLTSRQRIRVTRSSILLDGFPCAVMILEDLTRDLLKSEKAAYEKLIRTLSHEINNSLGSSQSLIRSCLTWAEHLPSDEQQDFRQAIHIILDRSRHLGQFMNSYADVIRLPQPLLSQHDVLEILRDLLELQRSNLQERGIELRTEFQLEHFQANLDRPQIEQALINVLRNSIEALCEGEPETPTILVRSIRHHDTLQLSLQDNGPGLSSGALQNLFTPFFTTRNNGQGIGLTLVRDILGNHGFEFSLDNLPEGGACFTLSIPGADGSHRLSY